MVKMLGKGNDIMHKIICWKIAKKHLFQYLFSRTSKGTWWQIYQYRFMRNIHNFTIPWNQN